MTYGVQMFDSTGALRLDVNETFTRIVHVEKKAWNFTGTFSVPEFDDTVGLFFVSFYVVKFRIDIDVQMPPDTSFSAHDYLHLRINPHAIPDLHWNNDTKTMTVAPHSLPSGFELRGDVDPPYAIVFIHYG